MLEPSARSYGVLPDESYSLRSGLTGKLSKWILGNELN